MSKDFLQSGEWINADSLCVDKRGKTYRIITGARDVQTQDMMVVYVPEEQRGEVLCCPLDAFKVSFKPVEDADVNPGQQDSQKAPATAQDRMMEFFDTRDFTDKVKILKEMYINGDITNGVIDNIAATIDSVIPDGDLDERFHQLMICVETRARFEAGRFRREPA